MLQGNDLSNWNQAEEVQSALSNTDVKFVWIKASEGATWRDSSAMVIARHAKDAGKRIGFYHYCRPENGNSAESEMANFVGAVNDCLEHVEINERVMLALDWEGAALGRELWLKQAIKILQDKYGCDGIVYCSQNVVKQIGFHIDTRRVGLWVAKWNNSPGEPGDVSPWSVWAFHQYTNRPIDCDVFNGSEEQLDKYCQYWDRSADKKCECHCHCCQAG